MPGPPPFFAALPLLQRAPHKGDVLAYKVCFCFYPCVCVIDLNC